MNLKNELCANMSKLEFPSDAASELSELKTMSPSITATAFSDIRMEKLLNNKNTRVHRVFLVLFIALQRVIFLINQK